MQVSAVLWPDLKGYEPAMIYFREDDDRVLLYTDISEDVMLRFVEGRLQLETIDADGNEQRIFLT